MIDIHKTHVYIVEPNWVTDCHMFCAHLAAEDYQHIIEYLCYR
jgi:hypothetical protein